MSVDELLVTALDFLDPVERRHYLDRACAGDEPLRREVESLLAAHGRIGSFLQKRPAPGPYV